MTEGLSGFGEFLEAVENLQRAADGDVGRLDSSMPILGRNPFLGTHGFAWNAEGQAVDPIDEGYMAAYWADNREGIGAVPWDPDWD